MADFESLLTRLIEHQVDFVLVGGFAAVAHGSTLMTQDIDICVRVSPDNWLQIQDALADVHPVHRMTPQRLPLKLTAESSESLKNLYLDTDLGPLDCLGLIESIGDYDQVKAHSMEVRLPAGACRILTLDALIRSKEALGRPRDKEAVLHLKAILQRLGGPHQSDPSDS